MVVTNEQTEDVVDCIVEKACTSECGDGKIFISDVSDAIRIRTKERGTDAIK